MKLRQVRQSGRIRRVWRHGLTAAAVITIALAGPALRAQSPAQPSLVGSAPLPALAGATGWLNSPPLTAKELRGRVVLVDFWDYSCINCIRAVPYLKAWADKYKASGLVVIGVHSPEFDVEKQTANVQRAMSRFGITYPVALDNNLAVWRGFHNQYWPASYFIDAQGKVRFTHFGEGQYDEEERWIQQLLIEARAGATPGGTVKVNGQGAQAAADTADVRSPETYIGYARAQHFVSPGGLAHDADRMYTALSALQLNEWALRGNWKDYGQVAVLNSAGGGVEFRFHARDLHMVLGPAKGNKPVRFRVTIDGHAPGADHGVDVDANGNGTVVDDRLYQLIRLRQPGADHTFAIEFFEPGVEAFSFTFG